MATAPTAQEIFRNPFNKDSSHHTPLGEKVEYGIPPATLKVAVPNPVYQPGVKGSRGRLERVSTFRVGSTPQGMKCLHFVKPDDRVFVCDWHRHGGTGKGLPMKGRAPTGVPYGSEKGGDNAIFLYPHNGAEEDLADNFTQFKWTSDNKATARQCRQYGLRGRDVRNRYNDGGVWGSGAIGWRHPGGFLRGRECDLTGKKAIRHLLNATATRHSGQGAAPGNHVLARSMAYPAWQTDLPLDGNDNQGDIPYGTILAVRWEDRALVDKLGLSPLGRQLFNTFLYHGCCICDGQGQEIDGGGVLQLRVDHELALDKELETEVEKALQKLLPHLWPVFNPRRHDQDAKRHSDGLIYVGGGGPLGPGAINNAWDAGAPVEPPIDPPVDPPVEPPIEPDLPRTRIVSCPSCGAEFQLTLSEAPE